MYEKILLPTDGSRCSEKAAEHALLIANQNNAELIVLNVLETHSLVGLPVEDFTRKVNEVFKLEGEKALDNMAALLKNLCKEKGLKEVKVMLETKEGFPADVILQITEEKDIDLVVMGASGKHKVERFLLGSVTEKVVRHAKCPVLTIR